MAIKHRKPLLNVPAWCDGCGSSFDFSHALSYRKGGLVTQHRNGDLPALLWKQVRQELVIREADPQEDVPPGEQT